jgi:hypothetical protein
MIENSFDFTSIDRLGDSHSDTAKSSGRYGHGIFLTTKDGRLKNVTYGNLLTLKILKFQI